MGTQIFPDSRIGLGQVRIVAGTDVEPAWFILGFVAMSVVASVFTIPAEIVSGTKTASKFLMVSALAAIGLNTSFSSFKKSGIRPMIHGFIISALVVVVALLVEVCMGIV